MVLKGIPIPFNFCHKESVLYMRNIDNYSTLGMHIREFCEVLVNERDKYEEPVCGTFNGIHIVADKETNADSLVNFFRIEVKRKQEEYEKTPEYKEVQEKSKSEIMQMNEQMQIKMKELSSLDFKNLDTVLTWCCDVQPLTDRNGVNVPKDKILNIFNINGYFPKVNIGEDFKEDDKENFARYIIGQALGCLIHMNVIHPLVITFTEKWREKFSC